MLQSLELMIFTCACKTLYTSLGRIQDRIVIIIGSAVSTQIIIFYSKNINSIFLKIVIVLKLLTFIHV